tara:strand:+ start:645 stop:1127 length:483 start_codon:yes stop_codon:yes gene_type:complete
MAEISAVLKAASGNSQRGRNAYYVDNVIDLTANSINPNGDTIQAITVPANTLILAAGLQVVESATMNSGTDATASLGFTGGDVDEFVATFDIDAAADGAYAPQIAITGLTASTSADVIDVLLAGSGASFTAGKIRVYAIMMDISDQGDMSADEVDRDTLA